MKAKLRVIQGAGERQVALRPTTTVGRRKDCDLCIPSSEVSRDHCVIHYQREQWLVRDLGSTNGTYVNGDIIQERKLDHGDRLTIGPLTFVIEFQGMPPISDQRIPLAGIGDDEIFEAEAVSVDDIPQAEIIATGDEDLGEITDAVPLADLEEVEEGEAIPLAGAKATPATAGTDPPIADAIPADDEDDEDMEAFFSRMNRN